MPYFGEVLHGLREHMDKMGEFSVDTSKFNPPYFYMGLSEEEDRAEKLKHIQEENEYYVGEVIKRAGDYVIRRSKHWGSYAVMHETWDGCPENFIIETRDEESAREFLEIIAKHGHKINEAVFQLEKIYCKEKRSFMNYYGEEEKTVVRAFLTGLKRRLKNEGFV